MKAGDRASSAVRLALVGPTASGKTSLACRLAELRPVIEAVSVDSMAVYREMDIGTAKPTALERSMVPWHMVDLLDPSEELSAGAFQRSAQMVVDDIELRCRVPMLVGGTGLYLRAVIDDLRMPGRWPEIAEPLERDSLGPGGMERLYKRLEELDPLAAQRIHPGNRRRLVRALEVAIGSGIPFSAYGPGLERYPRSRYRILGIRYPPGEQEEAIERRLAMQMQRGFLDEVRSLLARPRGLSRTARQALGYKEMMAYLAGSCDLAEATARALSGMRELARRQWRWFRRDPRVRWLDPRDDPIAAAVQVVDEIAAARGLASCR